MNRLVKSMLSSAALLTVGLASVASAQSAQTAVLGPGGELYRLHLGLRSEILGSRVAEDTHLLALEMAHPDGTSELLVVPETDTGEDIESTAALVFEEASNTVFLVWDSRVNYIHSVLKLVSFDGRRWSDVITVRGGWVTPRSTPRIAVTRDKYEVLRDGAPEAVQRTILHLAWWEASDLGDGVLYTPIVLENGNYVGEHDVIALSDLGGRGVPGEPALVADALLQSPSVRIGRDSETVLIGYADVASAQLRTAEIRPSSGAISSIAGGLRPRLIEFGSLADLGSDLESFAAQVRQEVLRLGIEARLNAGVRSYLAQQVQQLILDPATAIEKARLEEVADQACALIVELGNQLLSDRLVNVSDALRPRLIEFGQRTGGSPARLFTARVVASRPAPWTPEALTQVYLSLDGHEAIVAWHDEDRLSYVESAGDAWSEPTSLLLGDGGLNLARAQEMLRLRAEHR